MKDLIVDPKRLQVMLNQKKSFKIITFLSYSHVNKLSPIIIYNCALLNEISGKLLVQLLKAVKILQNTNKK